VNTKTLCKALLAPCLCAALIGCAMKTKDAGFRVVPMGNDTYSIICEAKNAFDRDADRLKDDATAAANNYCASQGKQMRLVSLTSDVPLFSTGYAKAKIVFKALNPGAPEVASEAALAAAPAFAPAPAVEPAKRSLTTDDLYVQLSKLDDLRKKGILTDDEFQAEKRKLLSRSN